jgi:hypothetical protein
LEFRGKKKEKGIKFDQKQALKAVLFVRKRVTLFYLDVYFDFWKRVSLAERQAENASKYKPIVQHSLQIDKLMIANQVFLVIFSFMFFSIPGSGSS